MVEEKGKPFLFKMVGDNKKLFSIVLVAAVVLASVGVALFFRGGDGPGDGSGLSAPSAPQNLQATAGLDGIVLNWEAPTDSGGSAITGYKLYRGTTSGSLSLLTSAGDALTHTNTGQIAGQTYYYQVSAVNSIGEGPKSSEASAKLEVAASFKLPESDTSIAGVGVGNDTITYTYTDEPGEVNYTVGDIIAGTTGFGYLRKVTEVQTSGNAVTLKTENATLLDVVDDVNISVNQTMDLGGATRSSRIFDLDQTLYSSGGTTVNFLGEATISDPRLVFEVDYGIIKGLKRFLFYIEQTYTCSIGIEANHATTIEQNTVLTTYHLPTITVPVGPVPVVLTPKLEIVVGAELNIEANVKTSVELSLTLRAGTRFTAGQWKPYTDVEHNVNYNPPTATMSVEAKAYATLPRFSLLIYGAVGPYTEVQPYLDFQANPSDNPWWTLHAGIEGYVGVKVEINYLLGTYLVADVKLQIYDLRWLIAEAPLKTAPATPQNLIATPGDGQVSLSWQVPIYDGGSPITGYKIYRGTTSGSLNLLTTVGNVLTYSDTGLTNDQAYYYQVSAVNHIGEGAKGAEASATPIAALTPPTAPQNFVATPGDGQVSLSWQAPADDGGSAITGYKLYRGTTSGSLSLLTTVGNVLSHSDTGLTNDQTYYYQVSAVNGIGEGSRSSEASATSTAAAATAPTAPQNIQATAGDGSITLNWQAPSDDGGSAVTDYKIYRGTTSGSLNLLTTVGNVLTYQDTGCTNGQTYYYQVSAVNSIGESPLSSEANATPTATPTTPGAPQSLTATPGDAQIVLNWQAPSDGGGSAITGYEIYRGTTSGEETPLTTLGSVLTYTNTGLTNGQTYYYQVSAVNSIGEGSKSSEASATPTPEATVPSVPQNLQAAPGDTQIVLNWQAPLDDGGSAITGYEIYRGTTSGGETLLTTLGSVLTYTNTGLTNGQTYYYQVSAVNSIGAGLKSSEVSATPQPTEGNGTIDDPFLIYNVNDLQNMSNSLTAHYALANDIDASATSGWNSGAGFTPVGDIINGFTGSLDGRNYTITWLYIDRPSTGYMGLFGCVSTGGLVKNVGLIGNDITGDWDYVGGLVGYNYGAVSNSYATGNTIGDDYVGGLVGRNCDAGTVSNSYATGATTGDYRVGGLVGDNWGTVSNSYATGATTGNNQVGGLVGFNDGAVSNSYATGATTGTSNVGGLVGFIDGTVSNSYATGATTGTSNVGGLVGLNYFGMVSASFWDTQATGQATSAGGTGKTTAEMMTQSTYTDAGWDFVSTWDMVEGVTYPWLRNFGI